MGGQTDQVILGLLRNAYPATKNTYVVFHFGSVKAYSFFTYVYSEMWRQ